MQTLREKADYNCYFSFRGRGNGPHRADALSHWEDKEVYCRKTGAVAEGAEVPDPVAPNLIMKGEYKAKADVNGDNKVNAADIVDVTNEIKWWIILTFSISQVYGSSANAGEPFIHSVNYFPQKPCKFQKYSLYLHRQSNIIWYRM